MKESYESGLTTHIGPESCGAAREGGVEALIGERAGRVFSRVRQTLRDADAARRRGRPHLVHRYREVCQSPARSETPSTIRTLKAGGTLIKPAITERILRGLEQAKPEFPSLNPPDPLTERETEVLRLMVAGHSNREIADAFGMSEGTVKNHVSSILSKLGVRDRTRAVLKALELGVI